MSGGLFGAMATAVSAAVAVAAEAAATAVPNFPYVVRGADIFCTHGTHIRKLYLPASHGSYIREKPMMHEQDCIVGLDANIPPFGGCRAEGNPRDAVIIEDAEDLLPLPTTECGTEFAIPDMPFEGPLCVPKLGLKWCDAQEETLIDGVPALTTQCTIGCCYGGLIMFMSDGQEVG